MSAGFVLVCVSRISMILYVLALYELDVYACDVCGGMLCVMNIYICRLRG
jgi:hypothetical protein